MGLFERDFNSQFNSRFAWELTPSIREHTYVCTCSPGSKSALDHHTPHPPTHSYSLKSQKLPCFSPQICSSTKVYFGVKISRQTTGSQTYKCFAQEETFCSSYLGTCHIFCYNNLSGQKIEFWWTRKWNIRLLNTMLRSK